MNSNRQIGFLNKIENEWYITYSDKSLPLYPEDALYCLDFDNGMLFDFEIIDEFSHPEKYKDVGLYDGITYAKLINVRDKEDFLYSKIEQLIIEWNLDGSKTAGHLTRKIMEVIK